MLFRSDVSQSIPGRAGSPTFDRLATDSILGALLSPKAGNQPMFSGINRALGLVYGGANDAVLSRLYEVIQDPNLTKALMRKATPQNVKLAEPVLRQLGGSAAVSLSGGGEKR